MITILRLPQVQARTGLPKSSVWARCAKPSKTNRVGGTLPPPIPLGGRTVGWPENEIAAINAARVRGKDDEYIRELVQRLVAARTTIEQIAA